MDKPPRRPARKAKNAAAGEEAARHTSMMAELYRRAEAELKKLKRSKPTNHGSDSEIDPRRLVHELQVHQVELEMQNSALLEARESLEQALERYTDLYDFAPVAYFTLDLDGAIQHVNLEGARLAGMDRVDLIGRPFARSVVPAMRARFNAFLKAAFGCESKQSDEFDLLGVKTPSRSISLDAQCASDGVQCRLVAEDITERKQTEETRNRLEVLAATNRKLEQEIAHGKDVEQSLRKSEHQHRTLLNKSKRQQNELRRLSHLIIETQEEERRRISRELHDHITQTLVTISFHLESLSSDAGKNLRTLKRKIAQTQKLVEQSVEIVHHFARNLRPPALDHLGLIPALDALVAEFTDQTEIPAQFTAFPELEKVDATQRIVIYRVVQSALSNVAKHSEAENVVIKIQKVARFIRLTVSDDGKSFDKRHLRFAKKDQRLGLLGMRERIEMVGGSFEIRGHPGKGTVVEAEIPFRSRKHPVPPEPKPIASPEDSRKQTAKPDRPKNRKK